MHSKTPKLTKIIDIAEMFYLKIYKKYTNRFSKANIYCKTTKMFLPSWRASIAQLVEQLICNQWVGSSSLSGGTIQIKRQLYLLGFISLEMLLIYRVHECVGFSITTPPMDI